MALMRKLIATSSVVVIFLVSTVFARNILQILSENEDGICTSMVETQGYGCEEHKVGSIFYNSLILLGKNRKYI